MTDKVFLIILLAFLFMVITIASLIMLDIGHAVLVIVVAFTISCLICDSECRK